MIGDSIIANMAAVESSMPAPFNTQQNLGVSGNTTAQILARIGTISASSTHVVVEGGTNDLVGLGDASNIIPNYTSILSGISSSIKVILMGIPQVDEAQLNISHPGYIDYLNNAVITAMNLQLIKLCQSYTNCVPATGLMARTRVGLTSDGIHPISSESIEITRRLLPYLGL